MEGTEENYKDGLRIIQRPYYKDGTKFHLTIYWGKSMKPVVNALFSKQELMDKHIQDYKGRYDAHIERKQKLKDEKKAFKHTLKVGDILYASWGYDQTNIDFYQVVEVKGKRVRIKSIAGHLVRGEEGFMCGHSVAVKDAFLTEHRSYDEWHLVLLGNHVKIKELHDVWAHLWDGKELYTSWYA